ncbi:unnamed protein product [Bursaphelenchus xylophilus]|uniref:glucuronosyltransferase n=1 Tax=Bursaphelenchus xylophilus TaxID=6326 RepID=A0A1I7RK96_BURXY|nr:unnamed protein product [Bursaphelenchus xylophilus]CAG9131410.1 unnamed protein product [Bursaphelenchus xylophilus]
MILPFLFPLFLLFSAAEAAKFLFYNPVNIGASLSHRLFIDKLADLLVDSGHEVVNYMPTMVDHDEGKMKRKARVLEWKAKELEPKQGAFSRNVWTKEDDFWSYFNFTAIAAFSEPFGKLCDLQMADDSIIEKLKAEKFDLGMSENFDPCGFVLFKRLGIKYAPVFSTTPSNFQFEQWGIPAPLSFIPSWQGVFTNPATFKDRVLTEISELYNAILFNWLHSGRIVDQQGYGTYEEILAGSQVFFVNSDEFVDFPRPISEKVVYIGGFGLDKIKDIPKNQEVQKVIDSSKKVFLISFGAYVNSSSIPEATKNDFLEAFKQFPDTTFIWRYQTPNDGFGKGIKNLELREWLPQRQILNGEKTVGFISHCGMNSMSEANFFGVPMICIPFYGDQFRNVKALIQRKIGLELPKKSVNKENLVKVLGELINKKDYYNQAKTLSKLIKAKPLSATDRFVKYAELAAKFNLHEVLDLPGKSLNFVQYYNLDVKIFLFTVFSSILFTIQRTLRALLSLCISSPKGKKLKKN